MTGAQHLDERSDFVANVTGSHELYGRYSHHIQSAE